MTPSPVSNIPQDLTWKAMMAARLKRLHDFLFGAGPLEQAAGSGPAIQIMPPAQPAYDDPLAIQKMAEAMKQRQQKGK